MLPNSIQNLIALLSRLPGVGQRTAARLAFWLINQPKEETENLGEAIKTLAAQTNICPRCYNLSAPSPGRDGQNLCSICADSKRDQTIICVVEDILDILPIERIKCYQGVYHVLGGLISPPDIMPEKLRIKELIQRIKNSSPEIKEIILAFNPTTEGDTTAFYLEKQLKPLNIKITRLGRGLSTGSDLEYADEATLSNALLSRK